MNLNNGNENYSKLSQNQQMLYLMMFGKNSGKDISTEDIMKLMAITSSNNGDSNMLNNLFLSKML